MAETGDHNLTEVAEGLTNKFAVESPAFTKTCPGIKFHVYQHYVILVFTYLVLNKSLNDLKVIYSKNWIFERMGECKKIMSDPYIQEGSTL